MGDNQVVVYVGEPSIVEVTDGSIIVDSHAGNQIDVRRDEFKILDVYGLGSLAFAPWENQNNPLYDNGLPPAPTGLQAVADLASIILTWVIPTYKNHGYTEVWRAYVDDRTASALVASPAGGAANDPTDIGQTYYYWIRFVSLAGIRGPWNSTSGVTATTGIGDLIDGLGGALQDVINESHLTIALLERLDGIESNQTDITLEAIARASAITTEGLARSAEILAQLNLEVVARDSAITTAIAAEVVDRNASVVVESNARISANAVQAAQMTVLQASMDALIIAPFDVNKTYIMGEQFNFSGVVYEVSTIPTPPNANPPNATFYIVIGDFITLNQEITNNATAIALIDAQVITDGTNITTNASDITALEVTVNDPVTGVAAFSSAISAIDAKTVTNASGVVTNTNSITTLTSTLDTRYTEQTTSAAALTTLTTRVSTVEGETDSQATAITTLNTEVGGNSSTISTQTTSIDGLEAQMTVKIDINGNVAGYGLASGPPQADGTTSEFTILADKFSILHPTADPTTGKLVFTVFEGKTSMSAAYITDLVVTNAEIQGHIQSDDYVAGMTGWKLDKSTGGMEANSITIYDGAGNIVLSSGGGLAGGGGGGVTAYDDLTGLPLTLADINAGEGSKLTGIAAGANVTADAIGSVLSSVFPAGVQNTLTTYSELNGTKPPTNADATSSAIGSVIASAFPSGVQNTLTTYSELNGTKPPSNADKTSSVVGGIATTSFPAGLRNSNTTKADVGLGSVQDGADKTSLNTAAGISGQGGFATISQITAANISTYIASVAIKDGYIANAAVGTLQLKGQSIVSAWSGSSGTYGFSTTQQLLIAPSVTLNNYDASSRIVGIAVIEISMTASSNESNSTSMLLDIYWAGKTFRPNGSAWLSASGSTTNTRKETLTIMYEKAAGYTNNDAIYVKGFLSGSHSYSASIKVISCSVWGARR